MEINEFKAELKSMENQISSFISLRLANLEEKSGVKIDDCFVSITKINKCGFKPTYHYLVDVELKPNIRD